MRAEGWIALLAVVALAGCEGVFGSGAKTGSEKDKGESRHLLPILRPEPVILPEGTMLPLVLETTLSSETSREGDLVEARLSREVRVNDKVTLPAGTTVRGKVTSAIPSGRVKGKAHLGFDFDTLVYKGKDVPVEGEATEITAPATHKRDAEIIGGGTVGGALIGALVGGKKGAGIGALIGAGAGTGVVLTNTGGEVTVPAGSRVSVKLTREAKI